MLKQISVAVGSLIVGGCHLFAPHPPTPEERAKEFITCFREEFKPSDEQLTQLKDKILKASEDDKRIANELRETTNRLESRLESEAAEPEIWVDYNKVKELKNQLTQSHFQKMLALRSILTPAQRSKFLVCKRKMGAPVLPHEG